MATAMSRSGPIEVTAETAIAAPRLSAPSWRTSDVFPAQLPGLSEHGTLASWGIEPAYPREFAARPLEVEIRNCPGSSQSSFDGHPQIQTFPSGKVPCRMAWRGGGKVTTERPRQPV